ncbi:MAG: rhomboid family intramembrane serine protease [Chitinophagales bacterium]|nr:rhomboid family intramembrane serine protease [Chitinophagales bacterium]
MSITILIIGVTVVISMLAFSNTHLIDNLLFYPYRMWRNKEWHRAVSCGFIHADFMHLFFNMFALYGFGEYVEKWFSGLYGPLGITLYVVMYFGAIALADTFNLFKHRDDYNYRSLGASGGVSAVIFASILFNPFGKIGFLLLPVGIPAIVFGPLYLAYCVYMAKRGQDNIGHLAHFTGAVFGFVFPIIFEPRLIPFFIGQIVG